MGVFLNSKLPSSVKLAHNYTPVSPSSNPFRYLTEKRADISYSKVIVAEASVFNITFETLPNLEKSY